jgi:NAD-dependent SIR2 family protein deacetylase
MEKIKLTCKACGKETERKPKPEPKNAKEARQILFICRSCGARNLRNGTAIYLKEPKEKQQLPKEAQVKEPERSADEPKDQRKDQESRGFGYF